MVPCDHKPDAKCDAEGYKQSVKHPYRTRDVILVRNIADGICEVHTRHQRNNRTDDNLIQMVTDSRLIQEHRNQCDECTTGNICRNL